MKSIRLTLTLLCAAALAIAARATAFSVTLDTSLLAGGTYYVDFQLNDGTGLGNGNNSAAIWNFNFGGGMATTDIGTFGGASGNVSSVVLLTDTTPFNEFFQSFTAGSFLSFGVSLTNNYNAPGPDAFSFALLDENLINLATLALGTDQFMTVDLTGSELSVQTFAGVDGIAAPRVPETGRTLLLTSAALVSLAAIRRRLRAPLAA